MTTKRVVAGVLPIFTTAFLLGGSIVGLLTSERGALADEGLAGFGNISSPAEQPAPANRKSVALSKRTRKSALPPSGAVVDPWGPVPTNKTFTR